MRSSSRLCRAAVSALSVSLTLVAACERTTAPDPAPVTATPVDQALRVHNGRKAPVFTFVVGRNASASIDWFPCADARLCPPIAPGEVRDVTIHTLQQRETEALFYWWHATVRRDGTVVPDSIRQMVIPLR